MDILSYLHEHLPNKTIKRVSDTESHGLRLVFIDETYLDINNIKVDSIHLTGFNRNGNQEFFHGRKS